MDTLNAIDCFTRSAEAGSFAEAARRLGMTPAAVGKSVVKLENMLGARLFHRSTRRLTLTEAGEQFLQDALPGVSALHLAMSNVGSGRNRPSGLLKISMGLSFGRDHILPLLGEFLQRYPGITPDWHFDNRAVDLIGEGFDAAIGGAIDLPPGAVARELFPAHRVLVASPDYLARHATIHSPTDLAAHDGILLRSPQTGRVRNWSLRNKAAEQATITLPGRMIFSDPEAACRAAQAGLGVTLISTGHAHQAIQDGSLRRVLADWYVDAGFVSIYFAEPKLLAPKTRAFVDFVVAHFRQPGVASMFSAA